MVQEGAGCQAREDVDQGVKRIPVARVVDVANRHQNIVDCLDASSFHQVELIRECEEHIFYVLSDLGEQVQAL